MNMFTLLVLALVVFAYYGGASCPKVLKDNRKMLLGVVIGLALFSFMGVEGFGNSFIRMNNVDGELTDYDADCCDEIRDTSPMDLDGVCKEVYDSLAIPRPDHPNDIFNLPRVNQYKDECDMGYAVPANIINSLKQSNQSTADYAELRSQQVALATQFKTDENRRIESARNAALDTSGLRDVYTNAEEVEEGSGSQALLDRLSATPRGQ